MDVQLDIDTIGDVAVLSVAGVLDLSTVPRLHSALIRLIGDQPGRRVVVDLDGVEVLDDLAVGALLGAAGRSREAGGEVTLVCTDPRLLDRFALMRLDRAVDIAASVHDIASGSH